MERAKGGITIIKRKKVVAGGHHGGAWKVAYADFVTAMMAFFLLMWLLSVTDEKTRLGLADYFSPTIPLHNSRGGGDGLFDGSSLFSKDVLNQDETGQKGDPKVLDKPGATDQSLYDIQKALSGATGDALKADPLMKHIATRITDEGLIIEVFDIDRSPLFDGDGAKPNPILDKLLAMIGRVIARTTNPIAITGHLAASDVGPLRPDPWGLSTDRAQVARTTLVAEGVADARLARVTGKADRDPVSDDVRESRNRRIEITLLRRFPTADAAR
ncbi:MAG: flagellar motor protein MotB [Amaricoccus sp.]